MTTETICLGCLRLGNYPGPRAKYCEESRSQMPDGKTPHRWVAVDSPEGQQAVSVLRRLRDDALYTLEASGWLKKP